MTAVSHSRIKAITYICLLLSFSFGCERQEPLNFSTIDCSECYQDKPEWGPINVVVTINEQNPFVPLIIYRGDIEESNIEYIDTTRSMNYWVDVPVNKYYSIAAKYIRDGDTIFAIDGDEIKVQYTENNCDQPCYYFKGGNMDIRLLN